MENEKSLTIPYLVHEGDMARAERTNKRMLIIVIILIAALIVTNTYWIWYESQFEDVVVTQDVDSGSGGDAIIDDGVHYNGESDTNG